MLITKLKKIKDPIQTYHSADSISASGLKVIYKKSVFHYLNKLPLSSKSLDLGIAAHILLYEGYQIFEDQYFVLPKLDLRKKDDKLLKESLLDKHQGQTSISNEEYKTLIGIYENFKDNELAKKYTKGDIEISHYGVYDDCNLRVRPDCIGADWISDIKTCQDASPKAFKRDLYKYTYHLQALFYCEMLGFDPENFRFIACETQYPYQVQVYSMSDEMIEWGKKAWRTAWVFWSAYIKENKITSFQGEYADDNSIIL